MNLWLAVAVALLVLALGIWIGLGAPGWPHRPSGGRRHRDQRSINPIAWGKRERPTDRGRGRRRR